MTANRRRQIVDLLDRDVDPHVRTAACHLLQARIWRQRATDPGLHPDDARLAARGARAALAAAAEARAGRE